MTHIYVSVNKAIIQITAWRLDGAKPLSEPILVYSHLDLCEILIEIQIFLWIWKCCLQNVTHFVSASVIQYICTVLYWTMLQWDPTVVADECEILKHCLLISNGKFIIKNELTFKFWSWSSFLLGSNSGSKSLRHCTQVISFKNIHVFKTSKK